MTFNAFRFFDNNCSLKLLQYLQSTSLFFEFEFFDAGIRLIVRQYVELLVTWLRIVSVLRPEETEDDSGAPHHVVGVAVRVGAEVRDRCDSTEWTATTSGADPAVLGQVGEGGHVLEAGGSHELEDGADTVCQLITDILQLSFLRTGEERLLQLEFPGLAALPVFTEAAIIHGPATPEGVAGPSLVANLTLTGTGFAGVLHAASLRLIGLPRHGLGDGGVGQVGQVSGHGGPLNDADYQAGVLAVMTRS